MTLNYLSPPGEEVSLQFARQGDNIVHISEVSKGLACNCICEECDSKLIARKGKVRQHHFAHHEKSDCKGAWETLTHEKAKEVIIEEGYINVPKPDSIDLVPVHFETVEPEVSIGSYRADVVGTHKSGKRLVIEIAVTHSCEWKKIQYFEEEKISSIEIYMNDLHSVLSLEEFKEYVLSSAQRIWIFNEKHANGQKEYEDTSKNGRKDGLHTEWYKNGQKKWEGTYKDGDEEGKCTAWYKNGRKRFETTYKDGELDGLHTEWYKNGQKKYERTYKDGEEIGSTRWEYYSNGQKERERTYKDGKKIEEIWWDWDGNEIEPPEEQ